MRLLAQSQGVRRAAPSRERAREPIARIPSRCRSRATGRRISCSRSTDTVATVTLNRPERKNPLTFESYAELATSSRPAQKDEAVKAVVITGAGGNFCSGGDVHEIIGPLVEMDTHGAARLHAHDRRPGQGDARLPAADRRRDRRHLRRRRRDHRDGVRPAPRHAARRRSRSCSRASASPAATWAPARSCRASSARAAPPSCSTPAASMSGRGGRALGLLQPPRARRTTLLGEAQALARGARRRARPSRTP